MINKEEIDITQTTESIIITSKKKDEFKQEIKWQPGQEWDLVITKTYKDEDMFKKYENGGTQMIDKEEIEKIKLELQLIVETVRDIFHLKVKEDDEDVYEIDGSQFLAIEKTLQYISELEEDNKRQKEINEEHKKINGELQEKITKLETENKKLENHEKCRMKDINDLIKRVHELEEIIKGKAIQEMGMSDLYKED